MIFRILVVILSLMIVQVSPVRASDTPSIVIVSSGKSKPYMQLQDAFSEDLKKQYPNAKITSTIFEKNNNSNDIVKSIRNQTPDLILGLGSSAISTVVHDFPDTPLIGSMVISNETYVNSSKATGVLLKIPPETHFYWMPHFLPSKKNVAILYSPTENNDWVTEAKKKAGEIGINIIDIEVDSPQDIPRALKEMSRRADVLLGILDSTVYSRKTAKMILLTTFRNKIPFVGLSKSWVKAGALYGLDWDYYAVGKECASVAMKILEGKPPSAIPSQSPSNHTSYSINLKTANHLKLNLDAGLVSKASSVFE